ncbi:MAG: hypothetical protein HN353_09065 [Bdellovibrionales bacterium]|nr:hypothetical protein [Bdellovibrionales bacterium]MBT3526194.1 hypothetical protein [Bdellovibrionales bacterium]MBT7668480.1 hypothetical protein [Bdellovibrionales bacterium]MBT7767963.1 hypothetical protein [Bdellovibrionales bacterium]
MSQQSSKGEDLIGDITAGIDVGSTYTKVVLVDGSRKIKSIYLSPTGFKLSEVSQANFDLAVEKLGITPDAVKYVIATGVGRHQVAFKNLHVTDLTAGSWGASEIFPQTRTILDIGGQTMKASRIDHQKKVKSFRLNDKCAAGTGAFIEKTAYYMGYSTEEIGNLLTTSKQPVSISGVCAVFAESEVINHLSQGAPPADIMQGAIESLTGRAIQLIKRAKGEAEYTLIGGILRFPTMAQAVRDKLQKEVNVADPEVIQFISAYGAALLGQHQLTCKRDPQ